MKQIANDLWPALRHNDAGAMVIFPGGHHRRNYSTNAIDCGIFVDSFYDLVDIVPDQAKKWHSIVDEVARSYIGEKLKGEKTIHNQYLWAATGLARWVAAHKKNQNVRNYKELLEQTLVFWLEHIAADGYSPYMSASHAPFLNGITTYYHSRCIAFSWYIIEQIGLKRPDIEAQLITAARFLAKMVRPDGVKQLILECKRYYFWGPYEVGSHPYDIYVYAKTYQATGERVWIILASHALRRLLEAQAPNGAIKSHPYNGALDWQCDIMRTGHLAWLARVPESFLVAVLNENTSQPSLPAEFFAQNRSSNLLLIGNSKCWTHFVPRKPPMAGYAGPRASGLLLANNVNINDISCNLYLHYRVRGNPYGFLRAARQAISATVRHVLLHAWDCLFHKRRISLAWFIIKENLLNYLWTGMWVLSTEFCCKIENLEIKNGEIAHSLVLTDLQGGQKLYLGRRRIVWNGAEVEVRDMLKLKGRFRVKVPPGWLCNGTNQRGKYIKIVGPGEVVFTGKLFQLYSMPRSRSKKKL
jgi:hypothetical protein